MFLACLLGTYEAPSEREEAEALGELGEHVSIFYQGKKRQ